MKNKFRVALLGNPNCGKTSIFNQLTNARQHVGNYPGVTVESKSGAFNLDGKKIELVDLPGIYSISSNSPEEAVVFNELVNSKFDLILNVIDSTIPQRSLYLTTQVAELHIPMILSLNMSDEAEAKGLHYDPVKLSAAFNAPVVMTIGNSKKGITDLRSEIAKALNNSEKAVTPKVKHTSEIDKVIEKIAVKIDDLKVEKYANVPSYFFATKLLEQDTCVKNIAEFAPIHEFVDAEIKTLKSSDKKLSETFVADSRYASVKEICKNSIFLIDNYKRQVSDRIDKVMTNKYLGLPIFLLIIYLTFQFTFAVADPFMGYIETFFGWLDESIGNVWSEETLPFFRSMIIDGIIAGVGGVVIFLPNILFLFFAIAILEDSGYMARASYVMDGVMRKFGLQGKSFIPLVLGFGCTVPAIMATRSIESTKDRTTTVMILPLMSCGARLPIYALLIPAFFADKYQGFMMWVIYIIGVVIGLIAALLLKKTLFKGDDEVYVMELPNYRMPSIKSLLLSMWDRGKMYLQKAGTIILATSIILYIINTYPEKKVFDTDYDAEITTVESSDLSEDDKKAKVAEIENEKSYEVSKYTVSGRIGQFFEPVFEPIGFDWKVTTASLASLAAKEVFVAQLGILYSEGEANEESVTLQEKLRKKYTPLQAFCFMLFSLLSIPCLATIAVIKRELNSWKMAGVEMVGLLGLAYVVTLLVYQIGKVLNIGTTIL